MASFFLEKIIQTLPHGSQRRDQKFISRKGAKTQKFHFGISRLVFPLILHLKSYVLYLFSV